MPTYKVLLVDDQPLFRDISRNMFESAGGFEIAGEARDGAEAVDICKLWAPDLVLMDVEMPHMNGFEAARRIAHQHPETVTVLASMRPQPEYHEAAAATGAAMFVSKRNLDPHAIRELLDRRRPAQRAA